MQIPLHNHVLHARHRLLQQISVSGIGVVDICLLLVASYQTRKPFRKVLLSRYDVFWRAFVVWERGGDG